MKITKDKINIRSKLAELLNFNQTLEQLKQNGVGVGKNTNNNHNQLQVEGNTQSGSISLAELSTRLGDEGSIVGAFVYDTTQDTDGGAWRSRTQNTSWYNEPLNTATRGSRREFPSVAVIVAEADKITIYDGDDPDLSMWYTFNNTSINATFIVSWTNSSISMLNGVMYVGQNLAATWVNFITDTSGQDRETVGRRIYLGNIADLETTDYGFTAYDAAYAIVDAVVNDVAMTVLPGAPVDPQTGLAIPTIAVATDGGVSVIKHDGSVVDIAPDSTVNSTGIAGTVDFYADDRLVVGWDTVGDTTRHTYTYRIPTQDTTASGSFMITDFGDVTTQLAGNSDLPFSSTEASARYGSAAAGDDVVFTRLGNGGGVTRASQNESDPKSGMVCMINSTHNTGWMVGDTKLATLSDTTAETLGVDESQLVTNGTFTSNTDGWQAAGDATISVNDNQLVLQTGANGSSLWAYQTISLQPGDYVFSVDIVSNAANRAIVRVGSTGPNSSDLIGTPTQSGASTFVAGFTVTTARDVTITLMYDVQSASNRWDNVSLTRKGNLLINGDFAGVDSDNKPTSWLVGSLASGHTDSTCVVVNGVATVGGTYGGGGFIYQHIGLTVGAWYTASAELVSTDGNGTPRMYFGPTGNVVLMPEPGKYSLTFQHDPSKNGNGPFCCQAGSGGEASFKNVVIRLAEPDQSAKSIPLDGTNRPGLQVHGTIDKKPVATGADLVAYSGFNSYDGFTIPYSEDMEFGTGDFSYMIWHRTSTTDGNQVLFGRRSAITGSNVGLQYYQNAYYVYCIGDAGGYPDGINHWMNYSYPVANKWNFVVVKRENGMLKLFIDGELVKSEQRSYNVSTGTEGYEFEIGSHYTSPAINSDLALFRMSKSVPTDEQIKKIYRDERPMFNAGAKCTLHGDDDYTWCTSYNKHNGLLHVGTDSGRSDFQGLIRVDQQNTPVTKFISTGAEFTIQQ